MRVLVTGGAGYIGSQIAKALASEGIEPVVLDNLTAGHPWAVRWGPFIRGDVGDFDLLRRILCEHRVPARRDARGGGRADRLFLDVRDIRDPRRPADPRESSSAARQSVRRLQ